MFDHLFLDNGFSSFGFVSICLWTPVSVSLSIRLRSRLWLGHLSALNLIFFSHSIVYLLVCLGSLSNLDQAFAVEHSLTFYSWILWCTERLETGWTTARCPSFCGCKTQQEQRSTVHYEQQLHFGLLDFQRWQVFFSLAVSLSIALFQPGLKLSGTSVYANAGNPLECFPTGNNISHCRTMHSKLFGNYRITPPRSKLQDWCAPWDNFAFLSS